VNVLLLVSSFNGLTQRVWCALREAGHRISVELSSAPETMIEVVARRRPDLILCPFLKERVPEEIWTTTRTVNIHPGPIGDKGPSSLDYAIRDSAARWGVTAIEMVDRMDAGPVWASRTIELPSEAKDLVRKSALYNSVVADAAVECALEVVQKAGDPSFVPTPLEEATPNVPGARTLPPMRQTERGFSWDQSTVDILRRIHAADGSPGVLTELAGVEVFAYDAHPGPAIELAPGRIGRVRHEAVLVGTGDGTLWIGHLRARAPQGIPPMLKLPARAVLGRAIAEIPEAADGIVLAPSEDYRPILYRRANDVGTLSFDFYNGAMSTAQCLRLEAALRRACSEDTRVLVVRGGRSGEPFSNGIHLNVIDAASDPAREAWHNIRAINEVCKRFADTPRQILVAAYTGNAGAGGVMMALGADVVVARDGVVLNPYYDIGLFGSELHSLTLALRVGPSAAARLLDEKLPLNANEAASLGLVDRVGPRSDAAFDHWLDELAKHYAIDDVWMAAMERKRSRLTEKRPLDVYEVHELAEMSRDMFEDRKGFNAARTAFVRKIKAAGTPERLTGWR
jgi:putative two-component system hydrogenase maturation factor HypX/HoxX